MATSLMIVKETENDIYFRVPCDCASQDHDISLCFSIDEHGDMTMDMESRVVVADYGNLDSRWEAFWRDWGWRFRRIKELLCRGYIDTSESFMLSKENLAAFEEAIRISRKKFRDKSKNSV